MINLNPLIVSRKSIVSGAGISRSVEERLCEPFSHLTKQNRNFNYKLVFESNFDDNYLNDTTHVIFNRPFSLQAQKIAFIAKKIGIPVIVDLDDIPLYFPENDLAHLDADAKLRFLTILRNSNYIVCSTEAISRWVTQLLKDKFAKTIPTGINFTKIENQSVYKIYDKTVLFTNAGSLKLGKFSNDWLRAVQDALILNQWKLGVFADNMDYIPNSMPNFSFGSVPWFQHKIMVNNAFPISVVPLAAEEDESHLAYAELKTPIKYILNGGLNIPGIYSNSPVYRNVVTNFETGILCENSYEAWHSAIHELINNVELRQKIQKNAFTEVREKYSIDKTAKSWEKVLKNTR